MKDKILLVAHDAGGAEVLCAWQQATGERVDVVAEGPAAKVFDRESISVLKSSCVHIKKYQCVITGTSYGAKLENQYIELAKSQDIRSIAVLDHWLHYPERFRNCGYWTLPDEIWTCDQPAQRIAQKEFPEIPVILHPNWYWEKIRSQVTSGRQGWWLLALENRQPRGETWRDSVDAGLEWLSSIDGVNHVTIRPHPTMEPQEIRNYLSSKYNLGFASVLSQAPLVEDLSLSQGVVGYQTTVLSLAVVCGKRAVSLVTGDERLTIPLEGIERV